MDDTKYCVELIATLHTTFNLKRTVPDFLMYKNLVKNDLTDALPPNDLVPPADTSMAIHHKAGSAKISKIIYRANIELTFEIADEVQSCCLQ